MGAPCVCPKGIFVWFEIRVGKGGPWEGVTKVYDPRKLKGERCGRRRRSRKAMGQTSSQKTSRLTVQGSRDNMDRVTSEALDGQNLMPYFLRL
ncbi:hypothetical protein SUGI_1162570 [Cryptomeria japonica]|nr:hypothetical protein SUGI_1162570 [Cryptomeria japonica]